MQAREREKGCDKEEIDDRKFNPLDVTGSYPGDDGRVGVVHFEEECAKADQDADRSRRGSLRSQLGLAKAANAINARMG